MRTGQETQPAAPTRGGGLGPLEGTDAPGRSATPSLLPERGPPAPSLPAALQVQPLGPARVAARPPNSAWASERGPWKPSSLGARPGPASHPAGTWGAPLTPVLESELRGTPAPGHCTWRRPSPSPPVRGDRVLATLLCPRPRSRAAVLLDVQAEAPARTSRICLKRRLLGPGGLRCQNLGPRPPARLP